MGEARLTAAATVATATRSTAVLRWWEVQRRELPWRATRDRRLLEALRRGELTVEQLAAAIGWPDDDPRAARVAATLVRDGLAVLDGDVYRLP